MRQPNTFKVRNAYDEWVHQYDSNENRTRDLNSKVLRSQKFDLAGKTVLEIGCGTGLNTIWLAENAHLVIGMDISNGMLKKAQARLDKSNVRLLQADITKPWPLRAGFDMMVANLILEHISDLAHVFKEAHKGLLPDGLFYVGELHPYKQLRGVQAKYGDGQGGEILVPVFRHSVSEYLNAGIEAGFDLRQAGEWQDDADSEPRLLTLLFQRADG